MTFSTIIVTFVTPQIPTRGGYLVFFCRREGALMKVTLSGVSLADWKWIWQKYSKKVQNKTWIKTKYNFSSCHKQQFSVSDHKNQEVMKNRIASMNALISFSLLNNKYELPEY